MIVEALVAFEWTAGDDTRLGAEPILMGNCRATVQIQGERR